MVIDWDLTWDLIIFMGYIYIYIWSYGDDIGLFFTTTWRITRVINHLLSFHSYVSLLEGRIPSHRIPSDFYQEINWVFYSTSSTIRAQMNTVFKWNPGF